MTIGCLEKDFSDTNQILYTADEPKVGMEFNSLEDARIFYNIYAYRKGFGIRNWGNYRSTKSKQLTRQVFCCSREGLHKPNINNKGVTTKGASRQREKGSMRTGCHAHVRVLMNENGKWVVSKFHEEHNHLLVHDPANLRYFFSHKRIAEVESDLIKMLDNENVSSGQIMAILAAQHRGIRNLCFTKKDLCNKLGAMHREHNGIDFSSTIDHFKQIQAQNPTFFYDVDIQSNIAGNIFWVDGRSRMAYETFGDVITFDTTYMTNKYNMPFAPFIGVNHHRQSILLGCALIRDESAKSFTWVFETFLRAMNGKHPKAILTDQDPSMKKTIQEVFPHTKHRFCLWHIMKKAREHLGVLYSTRDGFQKEFSSIIYSSLTIDEFEERWKTMVEKFNLHDISHLSALYKVRHQWVPAMFKDTFFADMCSTQRSEGMNKVLKDMVDSQTTMFRFVTQYQKIVETRYDQEEEEDFRTIHQPLDLCSFYPIERHARDVYTRTIFKLFKEQLKLATKYEIQKVQDDDKFILVEAITLDQIDNRRATFEVHANPLDQKVSCSCKLWEFGGILCAHALKILIDLKVYQIPSQYILKRWTKDARYVEVCPEKGQGVSIYTSTKLSRFNDLCRMAMRIANDACIYAETTDFAQNQMDKLVNGLQSIRRRILEKGVNYKIDEDTGCVDLTQSSQVDLPSKATLVIDPSLSNCKGKRKVQRFINPLERKIKQRTCRRCLEKGHNRRTCTTNIDSNRIGVENIDRVSEDSEDDLEEVDDS